MRGLNKVMLIGNVGKDPEVIWTDGVASLAKFPLATTETYKDKNGNVMSQTEWHNVIVWKGLADLVHKYVHKGSLVYIEGKIRNRSWEDKEKVKRISSEVVADNLVMLDKRKEQTEENTNNHQSNSNNNLLLKEEINSDII